LENGQVFVPESFKRAYDLFIEGEWLAMPEDPEWGGQGMPRTVAMAAGDFFNGANYAFMMYPGLTHGAALLVEAFGTDRTKETVFEKYVYWQMDRYHAAYRAGSRLRCGQRLSTTAVKNEDGTYHLRQQDFYLCRRTRPGGEHCPPGSGTYRGRAGGHQGHFPFSGPQVSGLTMTAVLGDFNDVVCTGIEHKMGINGNATCSLDPGRQGAVCG
jgi:hypothetical protein